MRQLLALLAAASLMLPTAALAREHHPSHKSPPPHAQSHKPPHGAHKPKPPHAAKRPHAAPPHHHAGKRPPMIGQRIAHAQRFQPHKNSRLRPPPPRQEYRVVNDHLVRVDSDTLRVVAVVGLLSQLLR